MLRFCLSLIHDNNETAFLCTFLCLLQKRVRFCVGINLSKFDLFFKLDKDISSPERERLTRRPRIPPEVLSAVSEARLPDSTYLLASVEELVCSREPILIHKAFLKRKSSQVKHHCISGLYLPWIVNVPNRITMAEQALEALLKKTENLKTQKKEEITGRLPSFLTLLTQ